MALLESLDLPLGSKAHEFSLKGVDDKQYSLADFATAKVLVIVFMCNHCPYVQAIWPRLVELQSRYEGEGVKFVGINPNFNPDYPEETFEKMKEYYERYQMNFPYLQDKTQQVAKTYKAQCTPDIYVYDSEKKLVYHGRLDDNWQDKNSVNNHDLADAIDALLVDQSPVEKQNPSMGCSIKWRE